MSDNATSMETTSGPFIADSEVDWEKVGDGLLRKILGYDDGLMLVRVSFKKGAVGVVHSHMHRQVSYVESGTFRVQIGKSEEVLRAGDSFCVPPHVDHGAVAMESGVLIDVFAPARTDFLESVSGPEQED